MCLLWFRFAEILFINFLITKTKDLWEFDWGRKSLGGLQFEDVESITMEKVLKLVAPWWREHVAGAFLLLTAFRAGSRERNRNRTLKSIKSCYSERSFFPSAFAYQGIHQPLKEQLQFWTKYWNSQWEAFGVQVISDSKQQWLNHGNSSPLQAMPMSLRWLYEVIKHLSSFCVAHPPTWGICFIHSCQGCVSPCGCSSLREGVC